MRTKRFAQSAPSGFTLVELLVVIVIIAILAGFLVVGVMTAMNRAREGRIRAEVMGLAGAIEQYRVLYGEYPPSNRDELETHINRLFPRRESDGTIPPATDLSPAHVLYFCLSGYSPNPKRPLTGDGGSALFDFDKKRLQKTKTAHSERMYAYYPAGMGLKVPYIYFHKQWSPNLKRYVWESNDTSVEVFNVGTIYDPNRTLGTISPEIDVSKDYQIISAGLEEEFREERPETNITSNEDGTEEEN